MLIKLNVSQNNYLRCGGNHTPLKSQAVFCIKSRQQPDNTYLFMTLMFKENVYLFSVYMFAGVVIDLTDFVQVCKYVTCI